jgi:hypothetical protein
MSHGWVSFGGSTWIAGRVVLPGRQVTFRLPEAGALTTTMEHCRCSDHHDVPSSWLRTGPGVGGAVEAGVGGVVEAGVGGVVEG